MSPAVTWCAQTQTKVGPVQLCQAPPPSMELPSGTQHLPQITERSSPPFILVVTLETHLIIHWIYCSYYQTLQFSFIYNTTFLSVRNFQVPEHVIIALGCTAFSDFDSTFNACVTHTEPHFTLYFTVDNISLHLYSQFIFPKTGDLYAHVEYIHMMLE